MKRFVGYAAMLALLSAPAFAAKNSSTVTISEPVTVGTTQLPAAEYHVTWTGTGSSAQVTWPTASRPSPSRRRSWTRRTPLTAF
jgi:hypothetical protein